MKKSLMVLTPVVLWLSTLGGGRFMPALDLRFEPGIVQPRQVQIIKLNSGSRTRMEALMQQVKKDPLAWDALQTAVNQLQTLQGVRDVTIQRPRFRTRLPRRAYLVFSPDKQRAAFMKVVELDKTTTVNLDHADYLQGL